MTDTKISALPASTIPLAGTEVVPLVQGGVTKQVSIDNLTAGRAVSTGALSVETADATLDNAYSLKGKLVAGTAVGMIRRNSSDEIVIDEDGYGVKIGFGGRYRFDGSGDFTNVLGNYVVGTSGKGIDFSATANTGTSELLADYEEGTFTVTRSGFTEAIGSGSITNTGNYIKIGNLVKVTITLTCAGGATLEAGSGALASVNLPFTPAVKTSGTWCNSSSLTTAGSVFAQTNGNLYVVTGWSATESAWTLETSFIV